MAARRETRLPQLAAVLLALTQSDLRARYGRGRWRLVKWLLDPFAALGVYLVLVVFVLDRGGEAPGLSLACAVVPFQLVIMVVASSMNAVRLRASIVGNMRFERGLIPLATVLTETIAFASACLLLLGTMVASGIAPTANALWLLVFVPLTILLSISLAYPCALFGLWFPDLRVFGLSLVRTLFFVAPSLVALDTVPEPAASLLKLNPLSGIFEGFRAALLTGTTPAPWQILVPLAYCVALGALFVPLYLREQRDFAKVLA